MITLKWKEPTRCSTQGLDLSCYNRIRGVRPLRADFLLDSPQQRKGEGKNLPLLVGNSLRTLQKEER